MRTLLAVYAAVVMVWPCVGAAAEGELTLDQVLERARERAPLVMAAQAAIDEARGRLLGASVLLRDNPEVEGGAGPRLVRGGQLLEATLGLRQTFELGGRRGARVDAAEAGLNRASAQRLDVSRRILRDAAVAFFAVVHAQGRLRLAEATSMLAADTAHIAERRHRAGDSGVLEVNVAAAAHARARGDVHAQAAAAAAALGELRLVLGVAADEPLGVRGDLRQRPHYSLPELLAQVEDRPDLQALQAEAREAQADGRLGRGLAWPNLGLGASYERDDGNDIAMGGVTLTLPVFERGQGVRAEAAARERRALQAIEASRRAIDVEVRTAYEVYRRREEAVAELERQAMPGLDADEALARRSYDAGQLSLGELLAIRREFLDTKREYLARLFEVSVAGVELGASAGVLR